MKGTVIKRGKSWSVVLDVGRDANGRRVRRWHSGYTTKREAERARIELLNSIEHGTYVPPNRLTVADFFEREWLPAKRATVKETTHASYEMHVNCHIVPRLGGVLLANLSAGHLNGLYADLLVDGRRDGKGGLSPTTVRLVHATIHKGLADAERWGRIRHNPATRADPPRPADNEMAVWSSDQLRAFLESVRDDRLYAAWLLEVTTGMRRGEVVGLRWDDVDLEAGTARVRQIRTVARYKVVTQAPKTARGSRDVSLDAQTVAALRAHRVKQMEERLALGSEYEDSLGLVFTSPSGAPIHPERFSRWFSQRCSQSGLPKVRLHDVRHSYVTMLLQKGVPLKVVSQRVGHASPMVTVAIYQHVQPDDDRAAADRGAELILGDR